MAWQRSALLFFPAWLCFALPAAGWERVSEEATLSHHNLDTEENNTKDKAVVQFGDPANVNLNADRGFQAQFEESDANKWVSVTEAAPVSLAVLCGEEEFKVTLPAGPMSEVKILGPNSMLSVLEAPESCGYSLYQNVLTVSFSGCLIRRQAGRYSLMVLFVNEAGIMDVSTVSCAASPKSSLSSTVHLPPSNGLRNAHGGPPSKCLNPTPRNPSPQNPTKSPGCSIPQNQHLACGSTGISSSQCLVMGCCVDSATSTCFYPMDECTADKQFIFAVHHDITTFPVTPTKLVVAGKSRCGPVIVNDKFVVFKFSVTECGTRSYEIGGTVIYTAEVQTAVRTLNLKFGIISRDNPLRVMVECRYPKALGTLPTEASVGYMVKSPSVTFPSKVTSKGLFGVELRIAEDKTYTKYLKRHHQPLHLFLGKLVYLEVRLTSPNPQATLLVNYCLAYPRSAKNVLVLIHEGCANPQDPNVSILKFSNLPQNRHQRRFMIQAFQFMDQRTNKYLDEEIYFMCSTEVCMPTEKTCEERCFDATRRSTTCALDKITEKSAALNEMSD
ncbi:zona pellucida sperm-binding protein 4-like [Salvelinus fontinalis]|uniref:zona pellucida sperm-binding protein 4-like n=1 Tax=Salvelinus fontinalis TaxID=8038 RepID=UPI002485E450|nr:zona pellucida sperm-binding protein 4-like [Salvelinus fontinalis]